MELSKGPAVKYGFVTRAVPDEQMCKIAPMFAPPRFGDLVAAEVLELGKNEKMESRAGAHIPIFPGDRIVGAFGNRYATDQFEGYVPDRVVEECEQLSVGGVIGRVASRHAGIANATRLKVLGMVCDSRGQIVNLLSHSVSSGGETAGISGSVRPEIIVVTGSSMDSGKTTTGGTIVRALSRAGFRVAAAKLTGTATGKDLRFFEGSGASPVLDFSSAGHPSTYMLGMEQLLSLYHNLIAQLRAAGPDYIVLEIADGVLQRETQMLLGSEEIRATIDHVFFAAGDSLAIESGTRFLLELGLPLRACSGVITQSALAVEEAEKATGIPCMGIERMMNGRLLEVISTPEKPGLNGEVRHAELALVSNPAG